MEEKKLTAKEIVKALNICTTKDDDMDCSDGCPMYEESYCTTKLMRYARDEVIAELKTLGRYGELCALQLKEKYGTESE